MKTDSTDTVYGEVPGPAELFNRDALLVTFSSELEMAWAYLGIGCNLEEQVIAQAREQQVIIPEMTMRLTKEVGTGCTVSVLGKTVRQIAGSGNPSYFMSDQFEEELISCLVSEAVPRFAGADWDAAVKELELRGTRTAFKRLIWFYKDASPDKKKAFHYAKKLVALCGSNDSYVTEYARYYVNGYGTEQDDLAYLKVMNTHDNGAVEGIRRRWKDYTGREWIEF